MLMLNAQQIFIINVVIVYTKLDSIFYPIHIIIIYSISPSMSSHNNSLACLNWSGDSCFSDCIKINCNHCVHSIFLAHIVAMQLHSDIMHLCIVGAFIVSRCIWGKLFATVELQQSRSNFTQTHICAHGAHYYVCLDIISLHEFIILISVLFGSPFYSLFPIHISRYSSLSTASATQSKTTK